MERNLKVKLSVFRDIFNKFYIKIVVLLFCLAISIDHSVNEKLEDFVVFELTTSHVPIFSGIICTCGWSKAEQEV